MKVVATVFVLLVFLCYSGKIVGQETILQVLAGKRTKLSVPMTDMPEGVVGFRIQYEDRKLASGEATRAIIEGRDTASFQVSISETLIAPLKAEVNLECGGKKQSVPLILFPAKPFMYSRSVLSRAKIRLIDPQGGTTEVFSVHDIPFESVKSIDAVSEDTGLLVIGENCDLLSDPDFINSLVEATAKFNVLCLLPSTENIDLKLGNHQIVLGQAVKVADSNLDNLLAPSQSWRPIREGDTLRLTAVEESLLGWPWIEIVNRDDSSPAFSIAFTGHPLIAKHEEVPAARHILFKLIEHQIKSSADQKEDNVLKTK